MLYITAMCEGMSVDILDFQTNGGTEKDEVEGVGIKLKWGGWRVF